MIPQKKDIAMNITTNIYMNTTTKYVPVPATSAQKPSPQKLKQESFVYRPPAPKHSNPLQNPNPSEIKPSSNLNPRPSGIQITKVSDLGQSSLFKGLDFFSSKPPQHSDRSKSQKTQQKTTQGISGSSQNHLERNQRNKLNDNSVSSTEYKGNSLNTQAKKSQAKRQLQQTHTQVLVRKPLGRTQLQQEKPKQVEKSPMITRKNQQAKNNSAQQESFTTQTSSYIYKPAIKRTSVTNETSHLNSDEKKQEVKKPEPKISAPVQNIYARNRSRESKEVQLNLEINTDVSYFKIQARGSDSRRSSHERPNTGRQSVEVKENSTIPDEKPSKGPVFQRQNINTEQKTSVLTKVESPKNIDSEKKVQKEVPYYMKPKPKVQVIKQTKIQQNVTQPPKIINTPEIKQSNEPKGYVYKPKTYQNPASKTAADQADPAQSKIQAPAIALYQSKKVPYYGRKQKQEEPKESTKIIGPVKTNQIESKPIVTQNKSIAQTVNLNQTPNSNIPSKPHYLRQNNEKTSNKIQKPQEVVQQPRPSLKNSPRQQANITITSQEPKSNNLSNIKSVQKAKSPQTLIQPPKYPFNRKPVINQPQTQPLKPQVVPKISSQKNIQSKISEQIRQEKGTVPLAQTAKSNTSGYVYQPPNRKIGTLNGNLQTISQNEKITGKDVSVTSSRITTPNQTPQVTRNSQMNNETEIKGIESPKNISAKNQTKQRSNTTQQSSHQPTKISPIYPRKQQQTEAKKQESSYFFKRNLQQSSQPKKQPQKPQQKTINPIEQSKQTIYRPSYLQNNKKRQLTSNQNKTNNVKPQQQKSSKKVIPQSAYTIFNILIKKKLNSNLKFAFNQLSQTSKTLLNRDKLRNTLSNKSSLFSSNYLNYLKTQAFLILKKAFLSSLISPPSNNQIIQGSRIISTKTSPKTKQSKQDSELFTLTTNNKKILCLKLHTIFNSKIRSVFKEKLLKKFDKLNFASKKSPIFEALLKIFTIKSTSNLSNAFAKLKFNFSYVQKLNDTDLLPLLETKNKKLSKQQIAKYLQNLYQNIPSSNTASRVSLLQKTPQKGFLKKKQLGKSPSMKSVESSVHKSQSQKVINLRTRIENIEKEKYQQQKITKDKESEVVSRKLELKRQMNSLKKESEQKKKENQELKEKLKKYEVFNNFGGIKDMPILRPDNDILEQTQGFASNQNIATSDSNEFLNILCNFYIENALKGNSSNSLPISIQNVITTTSDSSSLISETLNYLLNPEDQSGFPTLQSDQLLKAKLNQTRDFVSQKILVEQNLILKAQISSIESQLTEEKLTTSALESPKVRQQVDTMKSLVKNYIKQRYLWEWIRNSISKI